MIRPITITAEKLSLLGGRIPLPYTNTQEGLRLATIALLGEEITADRGAVAIERDGLSISIINGVVCLTTRMDL